MVDKLLILERDTKEELQKAIEKNVLEHNMRLVSFSVLEQKDFRKDHPMFPSIIKKYYEAWCIVSVPDKTEKFYNDVEKMGMTESNYDEDRLTRITGIGTDF